MNPIYHRCRPVRLTPAVIHRPHSQSSSLFGLSVAACARDSRAVRGAFLLRASTRSYVFTGLGATSAAYHRGSQHL